MGECSETKVVCQELAPQPWDMLHPCLSTQACQEEWVLWLSPSLAISLLSTFKKST